MRRRLLGIWLAFIAALLITAATAGEPEEITLTILETSDVHGRLMNYDYAAGKEEKTGLVKCASIIKAERAKDPELMLLDCGDTCQGNMVSDFRFDPVHPVIACLNYLNYDAWELGNHEFNFEFESTLANIKNFKGITLGGNIYKADGTRFAAPYFIKNIKGVKVAVIGLEAPHIPVWETNASHYDSMTFTSPMSELGVILSELKAEKPDVIIVLAHYGETGEKGEKGMLEVGSVYGHEVDAFLIGHAHSALLKYFNGSSWEDKPDASCSSVMMETGSNAANVGKLTLKVKKDANGAYKVMDRHIELLSSADAEPDPGLCELLKDVHQKSIAKANTVIGEVTKDFADDPFWLPGIPKACIEDSAILDLIHAVQLDKTHADISVASLFSGNTNLKAGPFAVKDGVKVYRYENTLVTVKVTGAQLKNVMEMHAGKFFNRWKKGDVTISFNPEMRLYEFDTFQGLNYEVDISKPVGNRIVNVVYKGKPLAVDQELVMVLNSYRYGQLVGEGLINAENLLYDSVDSSDSPNIRTMITEYIAKRGKISPECDHNWKIIGADLSDPQADNIYDMIRSGKIIIPGTQDGRTPNCESVNADKLRKEGVIPNK
ncbi:MAG: 5'-nucleotidase C-terminal domain-containing protein [bacterium]|nr:5'-nucleotidase C-terminal domain-containing protein [bacterium]